jgi:hypothetical protein
MALETRPIPGFDGLYSVTCVGRVWSEPKKVGNGRHLGKWLRPSIDSQGYPTVGLVDPGGKQIVRRVHRLVALAWIGVPDDPDATVNHKNTIKADNHFGNLEWVSLRENIQHAHRAGLHPVTTARLQQASRLGKSTRRLTFAQAQEIRTLVAAGALQREVAHQFGVGQPTISGIVAGKKYLQP